MNHRRLLAIPGTFNKSLFSDLRTFPWKSLLSCSWWWCWIVWVWISMLTVVLTLLFDHSFGGLRSLCTLNDEMTSYFSSLSVGILSCWCRHGESSPDLLTSVFTCTRSPLSCFFFPLLCLLLPLVFLSLLHFVCRSLSVYLAFFPLSSFLLPSCVIFIYFRSGIFKTNIIVVLIPLSGRAQQLHRSIFEMVKA